MTKPSVRSLQRFLCSAYAMAMAAFAASCAPPAAQRAHCASAAGSTGARPIPPVSVLAAPEPLVLPGCSEAMIVTLEGKIREMRNGMFSIEERAPEATPEVSLARLRAIWASPCLAHVARYAPLPRELTEKEVVSVTDRGLASGALEAIGRSGAGTARRMFVAPPTVERRLGEAAQHELAPYVCPPSDLHCGARAASWIFRAESAWRYAEFHDSQSRASMQDTCRGTSDPDPDGVDGRTPFERWAACVVGDAPTTYHYAPGRYRTPETGWLVLRGRRGHYAYADEIRAYDLATGSAYVASQEGALRFTEDGPPPAPSLTAFAGRVSVDPLREAAFVLLTRAAVQPYRSYAHLRPIPDGLPITLSSDKPEVVEPSVPMESSETILGFTLVDDGRVKATGQLRWDGAAGGTDHQAEELLLVMEAGLDRGCAPAGPPPMLEATRAGKVSAIDASRAEVETKQRALEKALTAIKPCTR